MNTFTQSDWIWLPELDSVNTYVTFLDEIPASAGKKYTIRISVDTDYALYIDRRYVAMGQYADYSFDKVYDELDITPFVCADRAVALRVDCWHAGENSSTVRADRAGLIFEVTDDTGAVVCASTAQTLAAPLTGYDMGSGAEHITGQLGFSFRYDARRANLEMLQADAAAEAEAPAAEAGYAHAVCVDKPKPARSRPIEKLTLGARKPMTVCNIGTYTAVPFGKTGERMQAAVRMFQPRVWDCKLPNEPGLTLPGADYADGVVLLLDAGEECTGVLSLDLDLPCDAEVLIGWGEHLEDLHVRTQIGGRNFAVSYWGKAGRNVFWHPFRRLGMRYLEVMIAAPTVQVRYAGICPTDYPLREVHRFHCADALHNRIEAVGLHTLHLCMHEHYEDCPWREQAMYTMDSRTEMLCGYYAFREFDFARASLRLIAQSIRDDDLLELCSPARVSITIPGFSAIYLTQLAEYLQHSGDEDFAREVLPTAERVAAGFLRRVDSETGLIPSFADEKYWNFYEWQTDLSGSIGSGCTEADTTFDAPLNALVSMGWGALAEMYDRLGAADCAARWRDARAQLNVALDCWFWDEAAGVYDTFLDRQGALQHRCELTNALMVCANAAPEARRAAVCAQLAAGLVGAEGGQPASPLLPVTLSSAIFKYDALLQTDLARYARQVFADVAARWGDMLTREATTFWETADGASAFGNAGSLCHGWSAVPVYLYHRYAAELSGEVSGIYEARVE